MKVVDAFWEKRNLGVSTAEVIVEATDTAKDLADALNETTAQYMVVKVPAGMTDCMYYLYDQGYCFVECAIHATKQVKEPVLSPVIQRMMDATSYRLMDDADYEQLYQEMRAGIFDTDRIYRDPAFTHEQASTRYVNWIEDERKRGVSTYRIECKNDVVGFFTFKEIADGVYDPFLSGVYKGKTYPGIGLSILYNISREGIARNGKTLIGNFSNNNLPIVKAHQEFGYVFKDYAYVYTKHFE